MLLTTYNPDAQAGCPKCGFVHCTMLGGNLAFADRYLDFRHDKCGTEWRVYIDSNRTMTLRVREALGE